MTKEAADDLEAIVENVLKFKGLDSLNLSGKGLKVLPARLQQATHLKYLYLNDNKLVFEPDIGSLVQLEELCMENNQLTLVPDTYSKLKSLKCLNLNRNALKCLSGSLLTSLQNLSILWLNQCEIMYLPNEIGNLTLLEKLGLKANCLMELPEELGNLARLKWLNLEGNQLEKLPDSTRKLKKLSYLNLNANKFRNVPAILVHDLNENLNVLEMENNQIGSLGDQELLAFSSLQRVNFRANPFVDLYKRTNPDFYQEMLKLVNFIFSSASK